MADLTRLTGTPWHIEKMTRAEGDPRRHRTRCIYYTKETRRCSKRILTCVGAAHCEFYAEAVSTPIASLLESESKESALQNEIEEFEGIKMIPMTDIKMGKIPFHPPASKKMAEVEAYYETHGELDKPIVVSVDKDKYLLEDKYLRYCVAKKLGLSMIPARIGTYRDKNIDEIIRRTGQPVLHKYFGKGHVKESTLDNVVILFESGKTITLQIKTCINGGIVRML